MKNKIFLSVIIVAVFLLCKNIKYFYAYLVFGTEGWQMLDFDVAVSLVNYTQMLIMLILVGLLFRSRSFSVLGLDTGFLQGLKMSFLFTLPMFIGYAFLFNFEFDYTFSALHRDMVLAGFFEEFAYRAFLFGILFHYAGWGFVPAACIASVFFGMGHLYQANDVEGAIAVFLFTALGSAGFAWFYMIWKNIWMVAFLHGFMDAAWGMVNIEDNVTGSFWINVFRFTTLGLAIYFSVKKAKAENTYSLKSRLWLNREAANI